MSILGRSPVRTHTGSYQTIASNAPIGLLCFRDLFEQEDAVTPNKQRLESVLARDFRDLENGTERSKARQDVINAIMTRRSRYSKYQTDISQCWCITNSDKSQTVLFEGIRFMMFIHDEEWVRVPLAGRLEVRPATRNGRAAGEVVQRKMTMDLTGFWQRRDVLRKIPKSPHSAKTNASPILPPYPELDGGPKLEAAPKAEMYGDVPPPGINRNILPDRQRPKGKESPQPAAPVQQYERPTGSMQPRPPEPRGQEDFVLPAVPEKRLIQPVRFEEDYRQGMQKPTSNTPETKEDESAVS
ncbi:unnamed protein product [Clonostachys rosea]|uniref:Uncharacterized protein n=1 Tax=Bionectria ochroleuca TaxID=29856 RepID=A0ABY6UB76_BIOOC|nr:unnamed protein product [Clonostachys rosea]